MDEKTKIFLFVMAALVLRLAFLPLNDIINTDGVVHTYVGRSLVLTGGYEAITGDKSLIISPLNPLLIGIFYLIVNNLALAGKLASLLAGTLLVIPVYFLAKKMYSVKLANIAALLTAFSHIMIYMSTEVNDQALMIFFVITSLYFGWESLTVKKLKYFALTGFTFSLAALARPEAVGYFGIFFLITLVLGLKKKQYTELIKPVMILFAVFLLVYSPWLAYRYSVTGDAFYETKGVNYLNPQYGTDVLVWEKYWHEIDETGELKTEKYWYSDYKKEGEEDVVTFMLHNPGLMANRFIQGLYKEFIQILPGLFPPIFMGLAFLGLFGQSFTRKRLKRELYVFVNLIYPFLFYAIPVYSPKFFYQALPLFFLWTAGGIIMFQETIIISLKNYRFDPKLIRLGILALILLLFIPFAFAQFLFAFEPVEYKTAGAWIDQNTPKNAVVMSRKPELGFYSNRKWLALPYANYDEALKYSLRKEANYWLMDERLLLSLRPQLKFLLEQDEYPCELELVHQVNEPKMVKIFKLKPCGEANEN